MRGMGDVWLTGDRRRRAKSQENAYESPERSWKEYVDLTKQ